VKIGEWATGFTKQMTDLVLHDPRAAFRMGASCSLSENLELIIGRLESEQEAAKRMFLAAVVGRYSESNFPELLQGSLRLENAADGSKFFRSLVLNALGVTCREIIAQSKKEIAKNPTSRETVCNAARHEIVGLVKGVSAWSKKSSRVALLELRLIKGLSQRDAAKELGFKPKKVIELESRLKKKLFGENHYDLKIFPSSRHPYNNPAGYDREPKAAGKVTAGNNLSDKEFIERYSDWLGSWAEKSCVERSQLFRELMSGINRDPEGKFEYGLFLDASSSPTTNEFESQDKAVYFTRIFYVAFAGGYGRFPQGGNLYPIPLRMVGHQIGCDYFRSVAITAARA
jgi:hypothetical protein